MALSIKLQREVNLVCSALKKAGIKFKKDDVRVDDHIVRLSYNQKFGKLLKIDDILWELRQIGYTDTRISENREICDDRRWFSLDMNGNGDSKRADVMYVSIDEVYQTVYIDC
jgi:hypothetical protein